MTLNDYIEKNNNQDMYEQIGNIQKDLPVLQKTLENKFWQELKDELNKNNDYNFMDDSWEKTKVGLSSKILKINIIRHHNLYYDWIDKNGEVLWSYITPIIEDNTNNDKKRINFEKSNNYFWQLGKDNFRRDIINKIVTKINDLIQTLNKI